MMEEVKEKDKERLLSIAFNRFNPANRRETIRLGKNDNVLFHPDLKRNNETRHI
jgi:hypothetical protein